jgi:trypsin-like peptidase
VVYGTDDRRELYEVQSDRLRDFGAQTVVALIDDAALEAKGPSGARAAFEATSWGERRQLCSSVRFAEQPAAAACSGVLVGSDLVLTAGHCARQLNCDALSIVFGYGYLEGGAEPALADEQVFRCAEVLSFEIESEISRLDYGWLRLDRRVSSSQRPATLARVAAGADVDEPLIAFGFGGGVPLKVQPDVRVRDARTDELDYFVAALDAFEGASGGPVIRADGSVVGVLAQGRADYVESDAGCREVAVLDEDDAAEAVTYAFRALEGLCRDAPDDALCSGLFDEAPGCSIGVDSERRTASWLPLLLALMLARRRNDG